MRKLILAFILLYATESFSAAYKCSNESGGVVYSDTACDAKDDRELVGLERHKKVETEESFLSTILGRVKGFFQRGSNNDQTTSTSHTKASANRSINYRCDGRTYCSQMTSCDEATFFINNCPGTKMDGDHDGIPCESQWCQ